MSNQDEKKITVQQDGKKYRAKYWIRGGTITVASGLGPDTTVDIGEYDKPADEIAAIVLHQQIDEHVKK